MSRGPKLHLRAADDALNTSLCGWMGSRLTDDLALVTCARCRKLAARELAAVIVAAVEAAPDGHVSPAPYAARYGAREVSRQGARAIERSRRGEAPEGRGWPTPEAAVRAWVRDSAEGASLRSTSDPDRAHRVQCSRDPSLGGREHATVERHRNTALAVDRAALEVAALAHACPVLTPAQCREVYLLRVCGRPVQRPVRRGNEATKQRVTEWIGQRVEDVAAQASERWTVDVTARHVALISRHFSEAVRAALVASGEMREAARSEADTSERLRRQRTWDPAARIREARG